MNASQNGHIVSEDTSLAVVSTELRHVKEIVERIERNASSNVTTSSWEQRNHYVDEKFVTLINAITEVRNEHAKDIATIWAELKSKRIPWTSTGAFIISATGLLIIVIPLLSK